MTRMDLAVIEQCNARLPFPLLSFINYKHTMGRDPSWFSMLLRADIEARWSI